MKLNRFILAGVIAATSIQAQAFSVSCLEDSSISASPNFKTSTMLVTAAGKTSELVDLIRQDKVVDGVDTVILNATNTKNGNSVQLIKQYYIFNGQTFSDYHIRYVIEIYDKDSNFLAKCEATDGYSK